MANRIPDLLFRVYTASSNGTNRRTEFRPASNAAEGVDNLPQPRGPLLREALIGRHLPDCPFVFFTSSLLFALVFAAFRKEQGESFVRIACTNPRTAMTAAGSPVKFYPVNQLMRAWEVEMRTNSDGSAREYTGEWVAMSSVILGQDACFVLFETLLSRGLYSLYPELDEINKQSRKGPKLYVAVRMLRQYGFAQERSLPKEKIDAAARLAGSFQPCAVASDLSTTKRQLLAWFLSIQKRGVQGVALRSWIERNCEMHGSRATPVAITDETQSDMQEVDQYYALNEVLSGRYVNAAAFESQANINAATIRQSIADWNAWKIQNREERRGSRGDRPLKREYQKRRRDHGLDDGFRKRTRGDEKRNEQPRKATREVEKSKYPVGRKRRRER